ncbi:MAG TPA: tetratricopeptide repeat protein [Gemmatimonadota bacterium]|nr:tetratricopeptide repeat protein [Gemmatimonadota bacterium]
MKPERSFATVLFTEGRRWIQELGRRRVRLIAAVVGLLVLAGAIRVATRDASRIEPEDVVAAGAAPGIAVLPFRVADPNLAVWREEIVHLLTANLDGVGGLRAIDSRTVLAQWHEGVSEGQDPDLRTILEIARETGGSYAVVGSAEAIGPNVRLSADVYELASGRAIGAARAEGSPDSLYPLVDHLSLGVLRAILKEDADRLPGVPDLASVTTASLPALKAYLEGEALYRKAAYENAVAAFRRAVVADSTFALAWLGLAEAEWPIMDNREIMDEIDRALALSDRLPQRGVMWAKAYRPFLLGDPFRTRELAQEFVHLYPDSPDGWWLLGKTFLSIEVGATHAPGDPADGERALLRAVKVDPGFALAWGDLLQVSFSKADRERVAERLEALASLAGQDNEKVKAGRLAYAIAWGDSAGRVRAWAAVDTLSARLVFLTGLLLNNGRFLSLNEALYRETLTKLERGSICVPCLTNTVFGEGKFDEVIRLLDHPLMPPPGRKYWPYRLHFFAAALPDTFDRALGFQPADTTFWFLAGAYAADRGRWAEHAAVVQAFRAAARQTGRDSLDSRAFGGAANALEGYGLWKRGRAREALPLMTAGQRDMVGVSLATGPNRLVCRWIGLLLLELGKPAEAIPYLQAMWPGFIFRDPFTAYEMGRAYAELGENRKAVEAYEEALHAWRDADPVLKPRIEAARREIARLGGTAE